MAQKTSTHRILAIWFPWFATERVLRHEPALARQVVVTITEQKGRLVLAAVGPRARHVGLYPGMVLADARALVPNLQTRFQNEAADLKALKKLSYWATRYTPWASVAKNGVNQNHTLFLDIAGCAHLFGGEEKLTQDIVRRLADFGLTAIIGVADTPGAAWAMAHYGPENGTKDQIHSLPPFNTASDAMTALKDLPVAALRLEPAIVEGLDSFGLRTIGALYAFERRALTERFNAWPVLRLDQALGVVDEPISPVQPVARHEARKAYFEPIATREDIERTLHGLLDDLCDVLNSDGLGARVLQLTIHRVDGTRQHLKVGTSRPSRWAQPLFGLFYEQLDQIDPGFGIEVMNLAATRAEPMKGIQANWERKGRTEQESLSLLVDRLGNRFGFSRVSKPAPRQSWLPERAVAPLPLFDAIDEDNQWPVGRERPLRLLPTPEPVEVTAPIPDDPPVLFRWHKRVFKVRAADGPERLNGEWWRNDQAPRDYYQVEDEEGRRYWLYREGLYGDDAPASLSKGQPEWFMHGVFG